MSKLWPSTGPYRVMQTVHMWSFWLPLSSTSWQQWKLSLACQPSVSLWASWLLVHIYTTAVILCHSASAIAAHWLMHWGGAEVTWRRWAEEQLQQEVDISTTDTVAMKTPWNLVMWREAAVEVQFLEQHRHHHKPRETKELDFLLFHFIFIKSEKYIWICDRRESI